MNQFHSVFKKPGNEPYRYQMQGLSLQDEQKAAADMSGEVFGEYLYSRQTSRALLDTNTFYKFTIHRHSNRLHYRNTKEVLNGQFDYFDIIGHCGQKVILGVTHQVFSEASGKSHSIPVRVELDGCFTFKFQDLCKEYLFKVSLTDGKAELFCFANEESSASFSIPLRII